MRLMTRSCCLLLAVSLALPALAPTRATAATVDRDVVTFGLLGAVLIILVYLGWEMDQRDKDPLVELDGLQLARAGRHADLILLSPEGREDEQITGVGCRVAF